MIAHGKEIKVFCGNSNPAFAKGVCDELGLHLGLSEVKKFADGEVSVSVNETVRGCDVFVVQSTCNPVNDNLMELLIMMDAHPPAPRWRRLRGRHHRDSSEPARRQPKGGNGHTP